MKSCSVHLWVLSFLVLVPVSQLELSYRTAKLHQPVTLPCKHKCSGDVKWATFSNLNQVLAQCDPTSCQSKEGFGISYDRYLDGDLDLEIRSVDYSHRTVFICECDGEPVCDVRLFIEAVTSTVQKKPGEVLVMDLAVPEPVEVVYKSQNSPQLYGDQICTVTNDVLRCGSDYTQRTSLSKRTLALRDLEVSDSGVYIIRDMKNQEVIHIYVVSVEDLHQQPQKDSEGRVSNGTIVATVVTLLLVVFGLLLGFIFYMWRRRRIEELEKENKLLEESLQVIETERAQSRTRSRSVVTILQLMKQITKVDDLIAKYSNKKERGSQSWTSPRDTTVEELLNKTKAEMDEFKNTWTGDKAENKEIKEWCCRKKAELDKIIEERRRERADLDELREKLRNGGTVTAHSTPETCRLLVVDQRRNKTENSRNAHSDIRRTHSWTDSSTNQQWRNETAEPEELEELSSTKSEQNKKKTP